MGTGLLAVPVLAGSAAYAVSEVFRWKASLAHGFHEARGFYAIIIAATGMGALMSVFELDPLKALVWSAIVNGVISVPIMVVMMWIGQSRRDGRPDDIRAPPRLRLGRHGRHGRRRRGDVRRGVNT